MVTPSTTDASLGEKFLPCPFCGGTPEWRWHSNSECWVECSQCHAVGPMDVDTTSEQNWEAWNTRATSPEYRRGIEDAAKVADEWRAEASKLADDNADERHESDFFHEALAAENIAFRIRALGEQS